MASLIKNQIVKHLSKFAKNLSSDQINLSTLRGEGDLTNLELNEDVFMDLLELPSWLRLTKILCNRVTFKIQWTKLKSVPILLALDEVVVEVETCEDLRQPTNAKPSSGKYGFVDKVVDSVTATVNSVDVKIKSKAFQASVQLSRLRLESRTPTWQRSDLRMTRLKDPETGEMLIFKELEWQTMRVEATAISPDQDLGTPIRLIMNQSRSRIIIKKRADCAVLASRLVVILDDLLWVLTTQQLMAAQHCLTYVAGLVQNAKEVDQKIKAAQQMELLPGGVHNYLQANQIRQANQNKSSLAKVFSRYDIVETSLHLYLRRIDLHFFDDIQREDNGPLRHLAEGSAMQVSLFRLAVDVYPYHLVAGDRKHWLRYETLTPRSAWAEQLMSNFRQQLMHALQPDSFRMHPAMHRTASTTSSGSQDSRRQSFPGGRNAVANLFRKMMATCVVLKLDDFHVYKVTTSATKNKPPEKFFAGDKERHLLAADMPTVHVEYVEYYYPGDEEYPVPLPNVHVHANPVQLVIEPKTILWLNAFLLAIQKSQLTGEISIPDYVRPMDVRVEALMPRAVYVAEDNHVNQPDRPHSIQVQVSRLVATNSRIGDRCARSDLEKVLENFQQGSLFYTSNFPSQEGDINPIVDIFLQHALGGDTSSFGSVRSSVSSGIGEGGNQANVKELTDLTGNIPHDLFWTENKAIWCLQLEPVWADFYGIASCKNQPAPFIDAVPITVWMYQNLVSIKERLVFNNPEKTVQKPPEKVVSPTGAIDAFVGLQPGIYALSNAESLVNVQVNHYQFVFLKRLVESMTDMGKQVAADAIAILGLSAEDVATVACGGAIVPEVAVSIVMPVKLQKAESEDLDIAEVESLAADLSSGGATKEARLASSASDYALQSKTAFGSMTGPSTPVTETVAFSTPLPASLRVTPADQLEKTLQSGSNAVKKGLSNLMASLDSTLPGLHSKGEDAQDDETMSIRSDVSSDSDQFVLLNVDTHLLDDSYLPRPEDNLAVESANEMKEDSSSEPSVACSFKRQDLMSIVMFRLGGIEVAGHSNGLDLAVKLQCSRLLTEEHGTLTWEDFQTKFASSSRSWQEESSKYTLPSCDMRARFQAGPGLAWMGEQAVEWGHLWALLCDASFSLMMSSVMGLATLLDDEVVAKTVPLRLLLHNIRIHLQEDHPSPYLASPHPIPLDVDVSSLAILRSPDGVFHIRSELVDVGEFLDFSGKGLSQYGGGQEAATQVTPDKDSPDGKKTPEWGVSWRRKSPSSEDTKEKVFALQEENDQLRLRVISMDTLKRENERLKELLKGEERMLIEAQDEVRQLIDEKRSLQLTMHHLKEQLDCVEAAPKGAKKR